MDIYDSDILYILLNSLQFTSLPPLSTVPVESIQLCSHLDILIFSSSFSLHFSILKYLLSKACLFHHKRKSSFFVLLTILFIFCSFLLNFWWKIFSYMKQLFVFIQRQFLILSVRENHMTYILIHKNIEFIIIKLYL